jgi:uncharacterized protein
MEIISMQNLCTILPTGPRLRSVHPIVEPDGSCRILYDQERTFIIEVPGAFRERAAAALDAGDFDSDISAWLMEEDLLTSEPWAGWAQGGKPAIPQVSDVSLDMSGSCNLACVYCFEKDINSRIGPMSDEVAVAALDFAFRKAAAAPRIALHFGSGEPLIRIDLLRKIVDLAGRRAAAEGKTISYELTTNATMVDVEIAQFFRQHPFNVRVSCDGPSKLHNSFRPFSGGRDSYAAVERGLRILLEYIPERVTVNSVLSSGTRLSALWNWAKELGLRRYHVIKVGTYAGADLDLRQSELAEFREDLGGICQDLLEDLRDGLTPIDYQPITKIVRRLMIPEPITRFCGVAGSYLGISANGNVYPCFRHLGMELYHLGDVWTGVDDGKRQAFLGREAADVDSRPICQECWARYLCGGGCYADSTVYGPDRLKPQVQHCPFWRTEIEMAIRFYNQLLAEDPTFCFSLFGDDRSASFDLSQGVLAFMQKKNCQ